MVLHPLERYRGSSFILQQYSYVSLKENTFWYTLMHHTANCDTQRISSWNAIEHSNTLVRCVYHILSKHVTKTYFY